MGPLAIVPIVEGHGEQLGAARILLERLVLHLSGGTVGALVLRPIRKPKSWLVEHCRRRSPSFDKLCRELEDRLAAIRASQPPSDDAS